MLKKLEGKKSIFFFEPIPIQKLLSNKDIRDQFLKLKIAKEKGSVKWTPLEINRAIGGNKAINDTLAALNFMKVNFHIAADGLYVN